MPESSRSNCRKAVALHLVPKAATSDRNDTRATGMNLTYRELAQRIRGLTEGEEDEITLMATVACEVHHADDRCDWTGFYRVVAPGLLKVGPYQGGHGCLTIPFDKGVCGAAGAHRRGSDRPGCRRVSRAYRLFLVDALGDRASGQGRHRADHRGLRHRQRPPGGVLGRRFRRPRRNPRDGVRQDDLPLNGDPACRAKASVTRER